jgi:hypothetical protein
MRAISRYSPANALPCPLRHRLEHPHLHLVGRADCHAGKPAELRPRVLLTAKALGEVGTERFGGSPDLVGQRELLDPRKVEARFDGAPTIAGRPVETLPTPRPDGQSPAAATSFLITDN